MKSLSNIFTTVIYSLLILFLLKCSKDQPTAPEITGPVCSITSPSNRSTFSKGDNVVISVDATVENGTLRYVQFVIDGEIVLWDNESPYVYEWDTSEENYGDHIVRAVAKDDEGETSEHTIRIEIQYLYQEPENTGDGWETSTLTEQSVDLSPINDLMNDITPDLDYLYSILIIRNEKLVFEEYFNGMDRYDANYIASATKSFTSTLIGIAINEGFISSLDEKMMDYFPEFVSQDLDSRKYEITLRQLIKMRSGYPLDSNEILFPGVYNSSNWLEYCINIPLAADPGEIWDYASAGTHILSGVLTKATGMSALEFAELYLFEPLGMEIGRWTSDPQGYNIGGWDIFMTPRNMAKLVHLYLKDGEINGKRILPEGWTSEATQKYSNVILPTVLFEDPGYGYLWWTAKINGYQAFLAQGHGGQDIVGIPELNMIVVTTTDANNSFAEGWTQSGETFDLISNYLVRIVDVRQE
ncbi:MAG: serine hydrolase [bacterium]|nr:serine hydrolase [bacterium]